MSAEIIESRLVYNKATVYKIKTKYAKEDHSNIALHADELEAVLRALISAQKSSPKLMKIQTDHFLVDCAFSPWALYERVVFTRYNQKLKMCPDVMQLRVRVKQQEKAWSACIQSVKTGTEASQKRKIQESDDEMSEKAADKNTSSKKHSRRKLSFTGTGQEQLQTESSEVQSRTRQHLVEAVTSRQHLVEAVTSSPRQSATASTPQNKKGRPPSNVSTSPLSPSKLSERSRQQNRKRTSKDSNNVADSEFERDLVDGQERKASAESLTASRTSERSPTLKGVGRQVTAELSTTTGHQPPLAISPRSLRKNSVPEQSPKSLPRTLRVKQRSTARGTRLIRSLRSQRTLTTNRDTPHQIKDNSGGIIRTRLQEKRQRLLHTRFTRSRSRQPPSPRPNRRKYFSKEKSLCSQNRTVSGEVLKRSSDRVSQSSSRQPSSQVHRHTGDSLHHVHRKVQEQDMVAKRGRPKKVQNDAPAVSGSRLISEVSGHSRDIVTIQREELNEEMKLRRLSQPQNQAFSSLGPKHKVAASPTRRSPRKRSRSMLETVFDSIVTPVKKLFRQSEEK